MASDTGLHTGEGPEFAHEITEVVALFPDDMAGHAGELSLSVRVTSPARTAAAEASLLAAGGAPDHRPSSLNAGDGLPSRGRPKNSTWRQSVIG